MRTTLVVAALFISGAVAAEPRPIDTGSEETIHIQQKITPIHMPRLISDPGLIPPYSDDAILGNVWVRAWVWLNIDASGTVQRVKFIKRPGYGLDPIAIDWALGLQFTPAVNQFGHNVESLVYLPLEWPSYEWLRAKKYSSRRLPGPADLTGFSVEGDGAPGIANSPARASMSKMPPCTLQAPLVLDGTPSIPHVNRDCSLPDLSHANAAELWYSRPSH
jgi:hypothetical protein